jgi:hypothetical protein
LSRQKNVSVTKSKLMPGFGFKKVEPVGCNIHWVRPESNRFSVTAEDRARCALNALRLLSKRYSSLLSAAWIWIGNGKAGLIKPSSTV